MKQIVLLFTATAAALVTPNEVKRQQISLLGHQDKTAEQNAVQTWWDSLRGAGSLLLSVEDRISKSIQHSSLDRFFALIDDNNNNDDDDDDDDDDGEEEDHPHPPHGGHGRHGHHGHREKTIYELIKESKHTTKFAKLVDEQDDIKKLLEDTEHNHTLFVPTDRAFERIPHHHHHDGDHDDGDDHTPSKEFILSLLKYHIAPGLYPLHRIRSSPTLPTELHPSALGTSSDATSHSHEDSHNPQRIRTFTTPFLPITRLNFHARLRAGDFAAKNGLIHALDSILIPPPSQTTLIRLLPRQFSTLALALETTGLADKLEELPRSGGGTLFAPTNHAWARLGPKVNAFLFSEKGKKYLRGLVKYHVVVNETVYSDAYYRAGDSGDDEDGERDSVKGDYWHVDLPSLLGGKPISVDVKKGWKGFVSIVVNGFVRVVVRDGVADDGVIQVVGKVLIPPREHRDGYNGEEAEEMSVEELKTRLDPYLEEEEEEASGEWSGWDDL